MDRAVHEIIDDPDLYWRDPRAIRVCGPLERPSKSVEDIFKAAW